MKKAISVALATIMLAGTVAAFAGCVGPDNTEINWDVDLSNPIELKGLFPNAGMSNFGKDATAQIIEDTTGYKVNYEELAANATEGNIQNYLRDREKFNFMKLNDGAYSMFLDGTFLDLTELLENTPEGRVLYQLVDLMDGGWDSVKYTDDAGETHIYAIPDFGYVNMIDHALIWNTNHLEQVGFAAEYGHAIPETLSEVTWAFEQLQAKFGSSVDGYHAFGVPGASSVYVAPLEGAFEVPHKFYVDDDGKIQQQDFSENMDDYVLYMNMLRKKGILSSNWDGSSATTAAQAFAKEQHSCVYFPYWNVTMLVQAIVEHGIIAGKMSATNNFQTMHDEAIAWQLRVRADGYTFENDGKTVVTKNQGKALLAGDPGGVSYYTVIPAYMAENARYVIDYLAKKMEVFGEYFGGKEGVHWNRLTDEEIAERGLPTAEEYTEENDAVYAAHESFTDMICFVRPYSYSYTDDRSGEEKTVNVAEEGKWVRLTEKYAKDQIADNSQYCTGTNAIAAKVYCHLHEIGFNAWYYCDNFADPTSYISDPMFMSPIMKLWGPVNITTRSLLLTGVQKAINDNRPLATLNVTRQTARTKNAPGLKYAYWAEEISAEMTAWYNANRK